MSHENISPTLRIHRGWITWGRYALRWLPRRERQFWFAIWQPDGGEIWYGTLGLYLFAFYAGDPPDWKEKAQRQKAIGKTVQRDEMERKTE